MPAALHFCVRGRNSAYSTVLLSFCLQIHSSNASSGAAWWRTWRNRYASDLRPELHCNPDASLCTIPTYFPSNKTTPRQKIPRYIWQTWKSNQVGHRQFVAMRSFIMQNPDYEYMFLDDEAAQDFICSSTDAMTALAYELLVPGAAKADILRVALLLEFGGAYFDSDCELLVPLSSFVWPNASVVSGVGSNGDLHQWALLYKAGHPFLQQVLKVIVQNVLRAYMSGSPRRVIDMTGPKAYHFEAIAPILAASNCTMSREEAIAKSWHWMHEASSCPFLPDGLGVIQLFDEDELGRRVHFKADGVNAERAGDGHEYYMKQEEHFSTLFRKVKHLCSTQRGHNKKL